MLGGQALLPPRQPQEREGALGLGWSTSPSAPAPRGAGEAQGCQLSPLSEKKVEETPGPQPSAPLLQVNFCGFSLASPYFTRIVNCCR